MSGAISIAFLALQVIRVVAYANLNVLLPFEVHDFSFVGFPIE
jgi:hypothetical protein